ncbi:hypothetical protein [Pedobacter heparinus]|uniref:hypothetical protein n=1 Tax=Pedobacter heparinus TaxID=984 RepID=UPI00292EC722|nr:hypothetical protein [Pedobacter heparinus]
MKSKILWSLAILGITGFSVSADPVKGLTSKPDLVIGAFIDAQMHNDATLFDEIIDNNALISVCRGKGILKYTKKQVVSFYKKIGTVNLNCESDYQVLSQGDHAMVVRVDFKFYHFTQQNFIAIEKDKNGNWKVVNVNRFNI